MSRAVDRMLLRRFSTPIPRPRRRRASYRAAVAWIAENDAAGDPDALDEEVVSGYVSTLLVADVFHRDARRVARDVVRHREREGASS